MIAAASASWSFQSTPPRGRRRLQPKMCLNRLSFNPRLHAGGDHSSFSFLRIIICFNPRLHAGGDAYIWGINRHITEFQSTPPRGRRPIPAGWTSAQVCFNPRLHAGGDSSNAAVMALFSLVSIHASTREATTRPNKRRLATTFQSTPPRGRRRSSLFISQFLPRFNPRLHAGGDWYLQDTENNTTVSIHASTREATYNGYSLTTEDGEVSIHASTREATQRLSLAFTVQRFNPRLHAGGD